MSGRRRTFNTESLAVLRMCFGSLVDATPLVPFAIDAPGGGVVVKGVVTRIDRLWPGRFQIETEE